MVRPSRRLIASLAKGLVFMLILVGIGVLLRHAEDTFDTSLVDAWIRGRGIWGRLLFTLAVGVFTALGLPRQIASFLGGYVFGIWEGTLWTLLGSGLGCAISFLYARFLAGAWVARKLAGQRAGRLARFNVLLARHPFGVAVCIRFLPVGNNLLTNLLAGVSAARLGPFLAGSMLGYIPQTLIFTLVGSGVRVDPTLRIGLAVALFGLATWLGFVLYQRFRATLKAMGEELPDIEDITPTGDGE